jgi:hypothetical protein
MREIIVDVVFFCKEKKAKMTFFAGKNFTQVLRKPTG